MHREILKRFVVKIFTTPAAFGVLTVAMAQTAVLPIGPREVEAQMKQQWKDTESTCNDFNRAKIDHVDIINNYEFRNWLSARHPIYADSTKLFPIGNYVRVASVAERVGDGIAVYGPVSNEAKPADFRNIVGLSICSYRR